MVASLSDSDFENIGDLLRKARINALRLVCPFEKISGKYKQLVKVGNTELVTISREERGLRFAEPAYIKRIDVRGPDLIKILKGLSLKITTASGEVKDLLGREVSYPNADGTHHTAVMFPVEVVCSQISLSSTLKWRELRLAKISLVGYTIEGLESVANKIDEFEGISSRLDKYVAEKKAAVSEASDKLGQLQTKHSELNDEIEGLEEERDSLSNAVGQLQSAFSESTSKKEALDRDIKDYQSKIEMARNNESQLRQSIEVLNRNISEKSAELRDLANDRNLISDEYSDYVNEGKKQSRVYEWFLYFCIFVIALAVVELYSGASRILRADIETTDQLLALSLQRLPFAGALALVVTVAWRLGSLFVARIMQIHEQRLTLARLLVIAKETVYSAAGGRDLSDDQKFREHLKLKLAMLRAHLAADLGAEFEYEPSEANEGMGLPKAGEEDEN